MYMNVICNIILTCIFGLLWAVSSLSPNSSTASIDEKLGFNPYKEDMTEINLLYPGGSAYRIKWLHVFSMI